MKKYILTVAMALLGAAAVLNAVPAKPGKHLYIQPDGSTLVIHVHGDEFYHWTTDESGAVVEVNEKGFYVPAPMPQGEHFGGRAAAALDAALIRERRASQPRTRTATVYHFPVILVNLKNASIQGTVQNVTFQSSTAQQDFYNLLNQQGYSANGGTGSVHDYYWDNSMGQFDARFDVYGPYDYDCNNGTVTADAAAAVILWSVIKAHDANIDWTQYDNDGDGYVDMVFMYYAGKNSAEGASGTIWPHKWNFGAGTNEVYNTRLDGKRFNVYACTSELSLGPSYNWGMCGIGTCAHEFSHTQGLPDFYDTNNSSTTDWDGDAGATYNYDIMCSGNYNNAGRTPPYFTAEERIMMGWLGGLADLPAAGNVTIPALNTNYGGRLLTSNRTGDGEYFVFECRSGTGWDAPLQPGLLVYHVDKSTRYTISYHTQSGGTAGSWTGYEVWRSHSQYVNANGSHPCCYIIPAADPGNLDYSQSYTNLPFPGASGVTRYIPSDWEGNTYGTLDNISFNAHGTYLDTECAVVTFQLGENFRGVTGSVMNTAGDAVAGATVSAYSCGPVLSSPSGSSIFRISGRIPDRLLMQTTTDGDGVYSFNLSEYEGSSVDIEVAASGYITRYESVAVSNNLETKDFVLHQLGGQAASGSVLRKTDADDSVYLLGFTSTGTSLASISFTSEELAPYAGLKILKLGFLYTLGDGSASGVYGIVDFGTTRNVLQVSNPHAESWNVLDVSGANLRIPSGEDCHFGYALTDCTYGYPFVYAKETYQSGGLELDFWPSGYDNWRTDVDWSSFTNGNLLIYVELEEPATVAYNTISNPGYGTYRVGDSFALELNEVEGERKPGSAVQWYFDDEPVSGASLTLRYPGVHLVEARFTTTGGKTKVVELEINVNP